jgi:hypothetical protein
MLNLVDFTIFSISCIYFDLLLVQFCFILLFRIDFFYLVIYFLSQTGSIEVVGMNILFEIFFLI